MTINIKALEDELTRTGTGKTDPRILINADVSADLADRIVELDSTNDGSFVHLSLDDVSIFLAVTDKSKYYERLSELTYLQQNSTAIKSTYPLFSKMAMEYIKQVSNQQNIPDHLDADKTKLKNKLVSAASGTINIVVPDGGRILGGMPALAAAINKGHPNLLTEDHPSVHFFSYEKLPDGTRQVVQYDSTGNRTEDTDPIIFRDGIAILPSEECAASYITNPGEGSEVYSRLFLFIGADPYEPYNLANPCKDYQVIRESYSGELIPDSLRVELETIRDAKSRLADFNVKNPIPD